MDFPGHFKLIFQQLNQQRIHGQLCDCSVSVGGQRFPAHRSILAACSSHFRALLSSAEGDEPGGAGAHPGDGPCVMELDQEVVTPEAFSTLLEMIYTSTLTPGSSNVMDVLLAASHLHLNAVVKACKLHLSKCDFPKSPPKGWRAVQPYSTRAVQHQTEAPAQPNGWRTVQHQTEAPAQPNGWRTVQHQTEAPAQPNGWRAVQHQTEAPPSPPTAGDLSEATPPQLGSLSPQRLQFSLSDCFAETWPSNGDAGLEGSQSGRQQNTAPPAGRKRAAPVKEDSLSGRKRRTLSREDCRERPPSPAWWAGEDPPTNAPPPESRGEEEEEEQQEEKYEAAKWEGGEEDGGEVSSQLDGGAGGAQGGDLSSEAVLKVLVGEEKQEEREEEEENTTLVEVKRENLGTSSPDPVFPERPPSPDTEEGGRDGLPDPALSDGRTTTADGGEEEEPHADAPPPPPACEEEEPVLGEALDSLSELAFSCFLGPGGGQSVMGALEVEESLARLTTATAAAAETIAEAPGITGAPCDSSDTIHPSPSSSSLVFPVATVPLQHLLSTQAPGFSDTLLLRPGQSPLVGGFLGSVRPALPPASGRTRGGGGFTTAAAAAPGLRRIAPKAPAAGSDPDPCSSSSSSSGAERPALTRASEEVLSKCRKAAAEDHVVLVEGEKKYACGICCKTFMNLTDCKKHIRVHTGEKPYPCPKCGKRFSQSSHLYKHSKNTCLHWTGKPLHPLADSLL